MSGRARGSFSRPRKGPVTPRRGPRPARLRLCDRETTPKDGARDASAPRLNEGGFVRQVPENEIGGCADTQNADVEIERFRGVPRCAEDRFFGRQAIVA